MNASNNVFDSLSVDELHTLATALGNAIVAIEKKQAETKSEAVKSYMQICIEDAEALLIWCNVSLREKGKTL